MSRAAVLAGALLTLCACASPTPHLPDIPGGTGLDAATRALLEDRLAAARQDPDPDNLGTLGVAFFAFDFPDQADTVLTLAAEQRPADWAYVLGVLKRQTGQLGGARSWLERAVGRDSDDILARARLGEVLLESGDLDRAASTLRLAVAEDSTLAFARFLLGEVLLEQNRPDEALTHLSAALRLQPQATQVHAPLAAAYRVAGDTVRAAIHLALRGNRGVTIPDPRMEQVEQLRQSAGSYGILQAETLLGQGRFREAASLLEAAVQKPDTPANAWVTLGVARERAGSRAGALLAFREAVRRDSTLDKAHFNLGMLALAQGDTLAAERSLSRAASSGATNPEADFELARLYRRSGRCAQAVPHLESALRASPESPEIRLDLVLCLNATGRDPRAVALLEEGLRAEPGLLAYNDALARILATSRVSGDAERALDLADATIAIEQRVETMETAALALAAVGGRLEDAVRVLDAASSMARSAGRTAYARYLDQLKSRVERGDKPTRAWPPLVLKR